MRKLMIEISEIGSGDGEGWEAKIIELPKVIDNDSSINALLFSLGSLLEQLKIDGSTDIKGFEDGINENS